MSGQRYEAGDQVKVTGPDGTWFGVVVADQLDGNVLVEVTYPGRTRWHKGERLGVGTAIVTEGEWIFDPGKDRYWRDVAYDRRWSVAASQHRSSGQ
jgi:hypothetical protein